MAQEIKEVIEEEKKVEEKPTTNEEKATKTYTEDEVKELIAQTKKNAIAEGYRKASEKKEQGQNDELSKLQESYSQKENEINELKGQVEAFKQVQKMDELGVDKKYQQDLLALLKGKGLEINEETITELAENHPEWKKQEENQGITSIGQTRNVDDETKRKIEQYEEDRSAFGLPCKRK